MEDVGKPPGGGSGEGIESLGVHVLTTEMGSANHARGLRTQITGAKWRISGRVQVGVLSTMCHCAGGGGPGRESGRVLWQGVLQSPCVHPCAGVLSTTACWARSSSVCMLLWVCLYAPVGLVSVQLTFLRLGPHGSAGEQCLRKSFSTHVSGEWNRDLS